MRIHAYINYVLAIAKTEIRKTVVFKERIFSFLVIPIFSALIPVFQYLSFGDINNVQLSFGTQSFFTFIIFGVMVQHVINNLLFSAGRSIEIDRMSQILELYLVSPVSRSAIAVGKSVVPIIESSFHLLTIMVVYFLLFGYTSPFLNISFLITYTVVVIFIVIMGGFFASFYMISRSSRVITRTMQSPLQLLSGTKIPVSSYPRWLQKISYLIPFTYALIVLREGIAHTFQTIPILIGFSVLFSIGGMILWNRMENYGKKTGSFFLM